MRKRWKIAAIAFSTVILTCSCAVKSNNGEERVQTVNKTDENENKQQGNLNMLKPSAYAEVEGLNLEPGTYISIIGKSADGEFWKAVKEGAERAVDDINDMLDYEGEDKVKVVYSGPGEAENVDEQVNILDEELARYPAAVGISIIDAQSCDVQFDLAAENDIPIVVFDSASNYQGIMAKVSTNNTEAARVAAGNLASAIGERGDVIVFAHDSKSLTSKERTDAFTEEIRENYPKMDVANVYYMDNYEEIKKTIANEMNESNQGTDDSKPEEQATDETQENEPEEDAVSSEDITDEQVMDYIFEKNPDVKGIYATNGKAVMTAVNACVERKMDEVAIIGFDADKEEQEAMKDGRIAGLLVQNPYGMGYGTVVAAARAILYQGNEAEIDSGYIWVTKDNIKEKTVTRILY